MSPVLFITYDGLLDQLGGSQILPYLYSIASHNRPLHILSFEKPERFVANAEMMTTNLMMRGIGWTPLPFTRDGGKLGKLWDLGRMYSSAVALQCRYRFGIIHCRSYQAMQVGCLLKRLFGIKIIFDMRGLWVDERVDGGLWSLTNAVDRFTYVLYKKIERRLLACATHTIVLTERVVPELSQISPKITSKLTVIPCCADFDHFQVSDTQDRVKMRSSLGVPANAKVISYLGSLGTWYLLEDMLHFFVLANKYWGGVHLLLITNDWRSEHENLLGRMDLSSFRSQIHIRSATRNEVPPLMGCSDVMLSFIKPSYSKMASSPTKLAEAFAMGIPVISNVGIGDVDQLTKKLNAGALIDLSDPLSLHYIVAQLDVIIQGGGIALRERARALLGLEVATQSYLKVYSTLDHFL